jgi:Na+-driven multidrug efflux pump
LISIAAESYISLQVFGQWAGIYHRQRKFLSTEKSSPQRHLLDVSYFFGSFLVIAMPVTTVLQLTSQNYYKSASTTENAWYVELGTAFWRQFPLGLISSFDPGAGGINMNFIADVVIGLFWAAVIAVALPTLKREVDRK